MASVGCASSPAADAELGTVTDGGPRELTLRMGRGVPSGGVDKALHISVLKELFGTELRDIVRAELMSAFADLAGGLHPRPVKNQQSGAEQEWEQEDARPGRQEDAEVRPRCLMELEVENVSRRLVFPRGKGTNPSEHPSEHDETSATGRMVMTTDVNATANYMHQLAMSKRLDAIVAEVQSRRQAQELARIVPSFAETIYKIDHVFSKIGNVDDPPGSDFLSRVEDNASFRFLMSVMTVLNCIFLTFAADWETRNFSNAIPKEFLYIDYAFLSIFAVELFIRIWRHRLYYFYNAHFVTNWADFIIVMGGLMDIFSYLAKHVDVRTLRTLRLFRMLKVLRVLRVLTMFKTLRVILASLRDSMGELVWCTVMIVAIQYMFALYFVMRVGAYLRENGPNEDLQGVFGSVSLAMVQLFTVSMGGGDWAVHFKILTPTGTLNQAIYLMFVAFQFIALMNVIFGIFVDRAMKNLELSKEERAREHAVDELELQSDLMALCEEGDTNNDGKLSKDEWNQMFSQGKVSSYLDLVGFRAHDLRAFFDLCVARTDDDKVDIDAFVRGVMRMRGAASCFDVQGMIVELHGLHAKINAANDLKFKELLKEYGHIREQLVLLTAAKQNLEGAPRGSALPTPCPADNGSHLTYPAS